MDYLILIVSGVVIGLMVAAPIGPVNLICIRRTLAFGPLNGFISGLGAAMGDGVFAIVTAFGLTAIAQMIEGFSVGLQFAGGTMLLIFGWRTYMSEPSSRDQEKSKVSEDDARSLARAIISTFALTVTNPATLFGFAALFAGLGGLAGGTANYVEAAVVVGGVFAGSTLWWFTVTTIVGFFHARIDSKVMRAINHLSGLAISAFGIAVLIHVIVKLI